ncbi:MAG TPA: hypothetical protein PKN48_00390 [Bacteroidales bacterium]|nr:hypothetical protein [Bacteroidales bacterium]
MTNSIITILVITIISLLVIAAGSSIFFGLITSYKIETWAAILAVVVLIIVVANKSISVSIPENAIKINLSISGGLPQINEVSKISQNSPELSIDTKNIPKWNSAKVGEISLSGEKLTK